MIEKRVLFVCMGNICRSPTAEGVFRALVQGHGLEQKIYIDSAGTIGHHSGEKPDQRAQNAAAERGYDLTKIKARKVKKSDYLEFDHILVMDRENLSHLLQESDPEHHHKIQLFMDYAQGFDVLEVPDPYYGGLNGFDHVIELIEEASKGFINHLKNSMQ